MGCALSLALSRLMSRRSALIVRSAADSSANWRIEPTTILRCLRLPSGPDSRHLNSQTSGPFNRLDRVILPFCIVAPFLLLVLFDQNFLVRLLLWQIKGEPEMQANKITGTAVSISRYASDIGELSYSLMCFPRGYNRAQTGSPY